MPRGQVYAKPNGLAAGASVPKLLLLGFTRTGLLQPGALSSLPAVTKEAALTCSHCRDNLSHNYDSLVHLLALSVVASTD